MGTCYLIEKGAHAKHKPAPTIHLTYGNEKMELFHALLPCCLKGKCFRLRLAALDSRSRRGRGETICGLAATCVIRVMTTTANLTVKKAGQARGVLYPPAGRSGSIREPYRSFGRRGGDQRTSSPASESREPARRRVHCPTWKPVSRGYDRSFPLRKYTATYAS